MKFNILSKSDNFYERHKCQLGYLIAFLLPLKLSLTYIVLIPALSLWLLKNRLFSTKSDRRPLPIPFTALLFFITIAICSSFFGLNTLVSIINIIRFAFFSCIILYFYDITNQHSYLRLLFALVLGQSLAAIHSVFEAAFPNYFFRFFLGKVTESGQISLTLIVAVGLLIFILKSAIQNKIELAQDEQSLRLSIKEIVWTLLGFFLFSALSFSSFFNLSSFTLSMLVILILAFIVLSILWAYRCFKISSFGSSASIVLSSLMIPSITLALLVNLKRGPWFGVITGLIVLLLIHSRKLIFPLVAVIVALILFVHPLRLRLEQSSRDFFIAGGRSVIWNIGFELGTRYPLGIGYNNSQFLQNYSPEIPEELKHFHNNLLNILVETGWLGLSAYLWFIIALLYIAFQNSLSPPLSILTTTLGCALLSWQLAGLVEYNFGDSEVVLIAFLLAGILLKLRTMAQTVP